MPTSYSTSITFHAIDRYRIHHPEAGRDEVHLAILSGITETPEVLGRVCTKRDDNVDATFVVTTDCLGCFVLRPDSQGTEGTEGKRVVTTYLRFNQVQYNYFVDRYKEVPDRKDYPYKMKLQEKYSDWAKNPPQRQTSSNEMLEGQVLLSSQSEDNQVTSPHVLNANDVVNAYAKANNLRIITQPMRDIKLVGDKVLLENKPAKQIRDRVMLLLPNHGISGSRLVECQKLMDDVLKWYAIPPQELDIQSTKKPASVALASTTPTPSPSPTPVAISNRESRYSKILEIGRQVASGTEPTSQIANRMNVSKSYASICRMLYNKVQDNNGAIPTEWDGLTVSGIYDGYFRNKVPKGKYSTRNTAASASSVPASTPVVAPASVVTPTPTVTQAPAPVPSAPASGPALSPLELTPKIQAIVQELLKAMQDSDAFYRSIEVKSTGEVSFDRDRQIKVSESGMVKL